jgi:hypothetical protein
MVLKFIFVDKIVFAGFDIGLMVSFKFLMCKFNKVFASGARIGIYSSLSAGGP